MAENDAALGKFLAALTDSPQQWLGGLHTDEAALGLAFALTVVSRGAPWRAQLLQDALVLTVLGFPERGKFVEVGVGDGLTLSNSAILESEYGWTGLLVEPNPHFQALIQANRPYTTLSRKAVLAEEAGDLYFRHIPDFAEISSLEMYASGDHLDRSNFETFVVQTVGVVDLFITEEIPKDLDYLSIDIEGPDAEVLQSVLEAGWRPKIITIEHNYQEKSIACLRKMLTRDYNIIFEQSSKWDFWAVRRDILENSLKRLGLPRPRCKTYFKKWLDNKSNTVNRQETRDLIVDIGMHVGEDTDFYLKKGFDVIAIEANSRLCEDAIRRFASAICQEHLRVLNIGVTDFSGHAPFYINETHSNFSSLDREAGTRLGKYHIIEIKTICASTILADYKTPHYIKIDIESTGMVVLADILMKKIYPKFVSIKNGNSETVQLLVENGYHDFKFINIANVDDMKLPETPLEGKFIRHRFPIGSSGPFGDETPGEWLNVDEIMEIVDAYWRTPGLDASKHGWFDLHACRR